MLTLKYLCYTHIDHFDLTYSQNQNSPLLSFYGSFFLIKYLILLVILLNLFKLAEVILILCLHPCLELLLFLL